LNRAQISDIWSNGPRGGFPRLASFRKKRPRPARDVAAPIDETNPISVPTLQRLERKEGLGELSPERRLIAAEPVHDVVVEIGQAQEADREVTRWIRRAGRNARSLKLLLAGCSGENILANLGAGSGESP